MTGRGQDYYEDIRDCPECGGDVLVVGTYSEASGDCEQQCGTVWVHRDEELQSEYDEQRIDEIRDERLER